MVGRTDDLPYPTQAQVNPALCVSCGICVGACPSSTPFRRSEELKTGIDLPDYDLKTLRERTIEAAAALSGPGRVLIFVCDHGGGRRLDGTVRMYLVEVKPPEESRYPWDYYKVLSIIPGAKAFRPIGDGKCPLIPA